MKKKQENITGMDPAILKIIEYYVKFVIGLTILIATIMALLFIFKNPAVMIVGFILMYLVRNEMKRQKDEVDDERDS